MKNIQVKKINNLIVIIFIFFVIIIFCRRFIKQVTSSTEILLMIKNDPAVLDAKILSSDIYAFFGSDYFIGILFNDGNSIIVDHVNEFGKGKRIKIKYVNDYGISIVDKSGGQIDLKQGLKFFSALIGVELETVMDIVKNYRAICNEIENWINLPDYKKDNEKAYETRDRILAENIFPFPDSIITFRGQEYFVFKWKSQHKQTMKFLATPG